MAGYVAFITQNMVVIGEANVQINTLSKVTVIPHLEVIEVILVFYVLGCVRYFLIFSC